MYSAGGAASSTSERPNLLRYNVNPKWTDAGGRKTGWRWPMD